VQEKYFHVVAKQVGYIVRVAISLRTWVTDRSLGNQELNVKI